MILTIRKRFLCLMAVVAIVSAVCVAAVKAEPQAIRLPVLMYHHLSVKPSALGAYVVTPDQFRSDMLYLKERGYETVTAAQVAAFADGKGTLPEKPVMITFDDGYESFYAYAFPILKELKMCAVLSVIGAYSEQYSAGTDHNVNYAHVTWDEIAEMVASGQVEIGNHTYDLHTLKGRKGCRIRSGEDEESYRSMLVKDVEVLQKKLTEVTGAAPIVFTYPYGSVCSQGCEVIEQMGFAVTLGCEEKVNRIAPGDPSRCKGLKRFNRAHGKSSAGFLDPILDV